MKKLFTFFLFVFLGVQFSFVNAQWEQTNGPSGGIITNLYESDGNIFACSEIGGIFKSVDNGIVWENIFNGDHNVRFSNYVYSISKNGNDIYAGTYKGVYHSTDNGLSWFSSGELNSKIISISIVNNKIYAVGEFSGLYISSDNGNTWIQTTNGYQGQK